MELVVSRNIDAEPAVVWRIVTDIEGSADVLTNVLRVERLDDAETFGVGMRWRETRTMFGKEATEEMQVTEVDPGVSYTVVSDSGKTRYTSVVRVTPLDDDRSELSMSFGAETSGIVTTILGATIGRLFQGATRRTLEQDLADLGTAAETSASG